MSAPPLASMATAVRMLAADTVDAARSGHPGLPLGMADVATVLFTERLRYDAADPEWFDRDRFVLSAGHGSALLYAIAALAGFRGVELDHLRRFRQLGSPAAGHPEWGHFPGVETTTGPLGQGLATAVGMAIAEARLRAEFGAEVCDHRTWVLAGDGCLMEGISHEAVSLAGHLNLDRLTVLWDDNQITIDGPTSLAVSDDQLARFAASGWDVTSVDGHDTAAVSDALDAATRSVRPTLIACRTVIGRGAPTKQGSAGVHGSPLGIDERNAMAAALDWPHPPFEIPEDLVAAWRRAGRRGAPARAAWQARMDSPTGLALQERLDAPIAAAAHDGLRAHVETERRATAGGEAQPEATRVSSQRVLSSIVGASPGLFGGSADLSGSNGTRTGDHVVFTAAERRGTYLHYGVREHAMAAAMNGIALHGGFVPYGGTFFVFSDYSRPAIRLAALMGLPVVHVLTHDSIGVGEDGPTHQPVEHLDALRTMPNLLVIRPCDAVETAEAWQVALDQRDRPVALVLSRQSLPPQRRDAPGAGVAGGAYLLADPGGRDVTLVATGSEVAVARRAAELLADEGIRAAVVSLPCFELFAARSDLERAAILGEAPRVGVEAAIGQSWGAVLRAQDAFVGMAGFGASAPADDLYHHFGITAEHVRDTARRLIRTPVT